MPLGIGVSCEVMQVRAAGAPALRFCSHWPYLLSTSFEVTIAVPPTAGSGFSCSFIFLNKGTRGVVIILTKMTEMMKEPVKIPMPMRSP